MMPAVLLSVLPAGCPPSPSEGLRASDFPGGGLCLSSPSSRAEGFRVSQTQTCINSVHKSQSADQMPTCSSVARTIPSSGLECHLHPRAPFARTGVGNRILNYMRSGARLSGFTSYP